MRCNDYNVTEEEVQRLAKRGYNEDILPMPSDKRSMGIGNYFTLWMGSIHNVPNYAAVGGFLFLGLSPINVMFALCISALIVTLFLVLNGRAGSKYGIPFAIHLRSTYGNVGARLPGFLRGCVAAIAWFGLQTYTGSQALLIILEKIFPGFSSIASGVDILGISVPGLIAFTIFWVLNVAIGFGAGEILNKFTAILSPLIYVLIIGMTVWAIGAAGGIAPIMEYSSGATATMNPILIYFMIFNSVIAVWAAPGASASDFTRNAKSTREQTVGQTLGLMIGYLIFAFCSVVILIGGSIHYGVQDWNILTLIERWDAVPLVVFAMSVFLLTTISTNATGNIIPAAYELAALFPKHFDYRKGVLVASVISFLIMPWKLMENSASIYLFLNTIGAVLGPVAGCMMANFYYVRRQQIDLDELYMDPNGKNQGNPFWGLKKSAYAATILGLVVSLLGYVIPALSYVSNISWFVGFIVAAVSYVLLKQVEEKVEGHM